MGSGKTVDVTHVPLNAKGFLMLIAAIVMLMVAYLVGKKVYAYLVSGVRQVSPSTASFLDLERQAEA